MTFPPLYIQAHISPAMSPKFLLSSAHNHGRQSVHTDTEITILQDGMTVRSVTQDWLLKSLPFTMPTVGVGETDVVYLDLYLHAMPSTCWQSFIVYIAKHWSTVNVPLLCHCHLEKKGSKSGPNTAFAKACK